MNEFVERLKQRESTAWAELYDRHIREIYGYVFHLVGGNTSTTEDVVQATWMNALQGFSRFDSATDQVRGWLFAIARSQVALHYRRERSGIGRSRELTADWSSTASQVSQVSPVSLEPLEELQRLELAQVVRASLLELSDSYRELLQAKYVERKTVSELASLHGKTEKAIEGLLSRARAELRSVLAWYFPTHGD